MYRHRPLAAHLAGLGAAHRRACALFLLPAPCSFVRLRSHPSSRRRPRRVCGSATTECARVSSYLRRPAWSCVRRERLSVGQEGTKAGGTPLEKEQRRRSTTGNMYGTVNHCTTPQLTGRHTNTHTHTEACQYHSSESEVRRRARKPLTRQRDVLRPASLYPHSSHGTAMQAAPRPYGARLSGKSTLEQVRLFHDHNDQHFSATPVLLRHGATVQHSRYPKGHHKRIPRCRPLPLSTEPSHFRPRWVAATTHSTRTAPPSPLHRAHRSRERCGLLLDIHIEGEATDSLHRLPPPSFFLSPQSQPTEPTPELAPPPRSLPPTHPLTRTTQHTRR